MSVLNTKVLVLNRSYLPIHITIVRRALSLLYQGVARAVDDQYRTFDFESWADLAVDGDAGCQRREVRRDLRADGALTAGDDDPLRGEPLDLGPHDLRQRLGLREEERPALVRAFVAAREDVVVDPGQHDARALGLHQSRLPGWQIGQTGHTASAHSSSFATKAR